MIIIVVYKSMGYIIQGNGVCGRFQENETSEELEMNIGISSY